MNSTVHDHPGRSIARGYSLVEVMLCVVIIGGMFVAALHTVSAARLGERHTTEHARAHMLAHALMDEILAQAYQDPGANPVFGPEPGEADGTRQHFDDVDDYHNWSASPPVHRDGKTVTGFDGWTRSVQVHWVDPDTPDQEANEETGVKRITVTVKRGEVTLARIQALRTRALHKERPTGAIAP